MMHGLHLFPTPAFSIGLTTIVRLRFMGSGLFRWELLTDPEPRSGVCPSRAQQRPLPDMVGKFLLFHPAGRRCARGSSLLSYGGQAGALRGNSQGVTTPVIHGSRAVACSDGPLTDHEPGWSARLGHSNVRCRGLVGKFRSSHPAGRCCARGWAGLGQSQAQHHACHLWFMGSCLFRWDLLTDPEPCSGVCPSRAQQRPLPDDGWKVPDYFTLPAWLRPGTGALRGNSQARYHACHPRFMERCRVATVKGRGHFTGVVGAAAASAAARFTQRPSGGRRKTGGRFCSRRPRSCRCVRRRDSPAGRRNHTAWAWGGAARLRQVGEENGADADGLRSRPSIWLAGRPALTRPGTSQEALKGGCVRLV